MQQLEQSSGVSWVDNAAPEKQVHQHRRGRRVPGEHRQLSEQANVYHSLPCVSHQLEMQLAPAATSALLTAASTAGFLKVAAPHLVRTCPFPSLHMFAGLHIAGRELAARMPVRLFLCGLPLYGWHESPQAPAPSLQQVPAARV